MKVLHVTSELYPLIKTGGLADVSYSLPNALAEQGVDTRVLLPGYRDALRYCDDFRIIGMQEFTIGSQTHHVKILEIRPQAFRIPVWIMDCPELFDRSGNPYVAANGYDWPDNAERFGCFSLVAAAISSGEFDIGWQPDVVHSHDWQTGMVSAFLKEQANPPRTVFTIHNLSYIGQFSYEDFTRLQLPSHWWHHENMEFYGGFSMLKAGLVNSDAINTVSPTYAQEILTAEFGYGMEGVLNHYQYKLTGILNGLDTQTWNPETDVMLEKHYTVKTRKAGKRANKQALLESLDVHDLKSWMDRPLFGFVGRLVEQKGIDILSQAIPGLLANHDAGFVVIGEGQPQFVDQLSALQHHYPNQLRLFIGYSEKEAHLLEAGCDFFVMPSRFEPCGLNQLYSLRYGTLPIVHNVGGLADTVVDASEQTIKQKTATGISFDNADADDLLVALERAMQIYQQPKLMSQLQKTSMQQDFGWHQSAEQYLSLYRQRN